MLGRGQEGEPLTVTLADESLRVGLLKEDQEPCCILEIFRARCGGGLGAVWWVSGSVFPLVHHQSLRRWWGLGLEEGGCCNVRRWSGLLVLKILKGFLVCIRGW